MGSTADMLPFLIMLLALPVRSTRAQAWTYPANDLASQFLIPQNQVRASVGEPPRVWDPTLAQYAAWYASQRAGDCALRRSLRREHILAGWDGLDSGRRRQLLDLGGLQLRLPHQLLHGRPSLRALYADRLELDD